MRNVPNIAFLALVFCQGCSSDSQPAETITLATTTSTRDSGLLDVLLPMFTEQTGIEVKAVAVGSGQALQLGRRGDADVLLTHAAAAEKEFMAHGFGSKRLPVMFNDFVLVGPASDPAGLDGEPSIIAAFKKIAQEEAPFVSRGDNSGTHMTEKSIWKAAGVDPAGDWYVEGGAGMAATLRLASEKRAYTLSDRGTFLAQRGGLDLAVLSQGDTLLRNDYSVILVNPNKHKHVKHAAAMNFAEFLRSREAQQAIALFGVEEFGQPLFFPRGG